MRIRLLASGYLLLAVSVVSAETTVYRCRDGNGLTIYQRQPCANGVPVTVQPNYVDWVTPKLALGVSKKRSHSRAGGSGRLAREAKQEKACRKAKLRIEQLNYKLRKGYRPAQGERWRQQRREKEDYLRAFCR